MPVTKADVLLTFCTYKVLYAKKAGGKNCLGNLLGGVLMATMRCARREDTNIKGADTESDFWLIIYSVAMCSADATDERCMQGCPRAESYNKPGQAGSVKRFR